MFVKGIVVRTLKFAEPPIPRSRSNDMFKMPNYNTEACEVGSILGENIEYSIAGLLTGVMTIRVNGDAFMLLNPLDIGFATDAFSTVKGKTISNVSAKFRVLLNPTVCDAVWKEGNNPVPDIPTTTK